MVGEHAAGKDGHLADLGPLLGHGVDAVLIFMVELKEAPLLQGVQGAQIWFEVAVQLAEVFEVEHGGGVDAAGKGRPAEPLLGDGPEVLRLVGQHVVEDRGAGVHVEGVFVHNPLEGLFFVHPFRILRGELKLGGHGDVQVLSRLNFSGNGHGVAGLVLGGLQLGLDLLGCRGPERERGGQGQE